MESEQPPSSLGAGDCSKALRQTLLGAATCGTQEVPDEGVQRILRKPTQPGSDGHMASWEGLEAV